VKEIVSLVNLLIRLHVQLVKKDTDLIKHLSSVRALAPEGVHNAVVLLQHARNAIKDML